MKKIKIFISTIYLSLIFAVNNAYAGSPGNLGSSPLVTGTKKLLEDGTTVLTGLVLAITVFFAIKNGIAWQTADEQDKPIKKKTFINGILLGIIVTTAAGLVKVILGYYGSSS